ncbi:MAG: BLUF domain-containing protein, partial [Gammaproteobacteria bacterium]
MFLTRLIYTSTISELFSPDDIPAILDTARNNNQRANVTGLLCFNSKYFLQCLEGSREEVNKIYHLIINDDRHRLVTLLYYGEISVREFGKWSMGYIP